MLYGAKVAVCFEINTKHINTVWQNVKFLNAKPFGASRNQKAFKGEYRHGGRVKLRVFGGIVALCCNVQ